MELGKLFIIIGAAIVLVGIFYVLFPRTSFPPRLPGDIFIQKGNFTFYFPIVSSILVSILVSVVLYFFFRK